MLCAVNFVREKTRGEKRIHDANELFEGVWGAVHCGEGKSIDITGRIATEMIAMIQMAER
jgi:hypothetical protein